jgi:hypothetical protein
MGMNGESNQRREQEAAVQAAGIVLVTTLTGLNTPTIRKCGQLPY